MSESEILQSLPNRPLSPDEIDKMGSHTEVQSVTPLYAGMINPAAIGTEQIHGVVLATADTVYSLGFAGDENTWRVLWSQPIDDNELTPLMQTGFQELRSEFDTATGLGETDTTTSS